MKLVGLWRISRHLQPLMLDVTEPAIERPRSKSFTRLRLFSVMRYDTRRLNWCQ